MIESFKKNEMLDEVITSIRLNIFIDKMSIKYKANLCHQLGQLDNIMAKYSNPYQSRQPSTPEFINGQPQPNFQDLNALRETKANLSTNMAGLK